MLGHVYKDDLLDNRNKNSLCLILQDLMLLAGLLAREIDRLVRVVLLWEEGVNSNVVRLNCFSNTVVRNFVYLNANLSLSTA